MENPNVQNHIAVDLCATGDPTAGNHGGRPPNGTLLLEESEVLERPGSPVPTGFQPVQKKGRRVDMSMNEEMMFVDEGLQERSQGGGYPISMSGMGNGVQSPAMPSFKDMLIGDKGKAHEAKVMLWATRIMLWATRLRVLVLWCSRRIWGLTLILWVRISNRMGYDAKRGCLMWRLTTTFLPMQL
ncbi:hypothetical protein V6N13_082832 [Hibiscus sabdariffa]